MDLIWKNYLLRLVFFYKKLCQAVDAVKVAEACWAAVISNKERRIVKLPLIEKVI